MKPLRKLILASLGILPFIAPTDAAIADRLGDMDDNAPSSKITETRSRFSGSSDAPDDNSLLSSTQELPWRKSRFSIEAQTGSRSIGTIDAFVPFMGNDDFIVYANLMAKIGTGADNKNGNAFEGNAGLGLRRVNDSETAIYGVYAFFDYLKSVNDNTFTQVTVGAERLGLTWDFRANAYLPVGKTKYQKTIYEGGKIVISEHDLIEYLKSSTEVANIGGDIEIGRTIGSDKLRAYLAAYTFGADLTGPRARVEYKLTDSLTLNAAVQYDKARGTQYLVGMRYSIGGAKATKSNSIYSRLTDTVVRDVDVVTTAKTADLTKTEKDKIWVVDLDSGPGGDGTVENPYGYIDKAVQEAAEGAIIYVTGKDGSINRLYDQIKLKQGQILWGGSKALYWDFANSKPVFAEDKNSLLIKEADGTRQTIGGSIITADNTGIYNFDIVADGDNLDSSGIFVNNSKNVYIDNVTIEGFADKSGNENYSGIHVKGDSSVFLDDIDIKNSDTGILVEGGTIAVNNVSIENVTQDGIYATDGFISANNITISNAGRDAISINNASLNANALNIENVGRYGVNLQNGSIELDTTANINLTSNDALHIINGSFNAADLNIHDSLGHGIFQQGGLLNVTNGITISLSSKDGIHLEDGVQFNSNDITIKDSADNAIYNDSSSISARTLTVSNTGLHGIYQNNGVLDVLGTINVSQIEMDGVHNINSILSSGAVNVENAQQNGVYQSGGEFNALLGVNSHDNIKDGFFAENAKVNLGKNTVIENNTGNGLVINNGDFSIENITATKNSGAGITLNDGHGKIESLMSLENQNGFINSAHVVVANANVTTNHGDGIITTGGELVVSDSASIMNNENNGINAQGGSATFNETTISGHEQDGVVVSNDANINLFNSVITQNQQHAIDIQSGSVNADDLTINANGNISDATSLENIEQLISAIKVGSDDTVGTFNAKTLTVKNNSAGIEVENGSVNINADGRDAINRSTIDNNSGYGIWMHSEGDNKTHNLNIFNTDIKNIKVMPYKGKGGYGLYLQANSKTELTDVNIENNMATGAWIYGGESVFNNVNVVNNDIGIFLFDASLTLLYSTVSDNTGYGIYLERVNSPYRPGLVIGESIIKNTKAGGINADETERDGSGIFSKDPSYIDIGNSQIIDNEGYGIRVFAGDLQAHGRTVDDIRKDAYAMIIANNGKDGIYQQDKFYTSFKIALGNLLITHNGGTGVFAPNATAVEVKNIYVTANAGRGLNFSNFQVASSSGFIKDSVIENNGDSSRFPEYLDAGGNEFNI